MSVVDWLPYLFLVLKGLLVLVSIVFFFSGLDDFFFDLFHMVRAFYRKLFVLPRYQPLTVKQLHQPSEQPIAIMLPAWDESAVIRRMLENNLRTLNYAKYHVFVGTYPNDPETQREVERVRERFDNVHRIVCPKDGPTSKADCLNWIHQGIRNFEKESGIRFGIFVLADSEDILHPLSLKLFNHLVPRKDMVQLPVFPLETAWHNFTAGHYADEFAENHSKDLLVREWLTGAIPCAGVGCAFSRKAMDLVARDHNNQLFNIHSLTEDYEFGIRLGDYNLEQVFVRHAIEKVTTKKSRWSGKTRETRVREYIATREYFPSRFWQAVRQKSRWMIGINLQGWANLGWKGSLRARYVLARDRKALFSHQAILLGYVVLLAFAGIWVFQRLNPDAYRFPPVVERGTWLWCLLLGNAFFLCARFFQRAFWTQRVYGWRQALLSFPRQIWGNAVNIAATCRALYSFTRYLLTGKLIAWDKTAHVFPSEQELRAYRRKLGDLLLEKRFITVKQLETALEHQKKVHRPLGSILVELGWVREDDLVQILGVQFQLRTRRIHPEETPLELMKLVPRELAAQFTVFPVELTAEGRLVLASDNALAAEDVSRLENLLGYPIEVCLSTHGDVAYAIQHGYAHMDQPRGAYTKTALGELLLQRNLLTRDQLREALEARRRSYKRLGKILVDEALITPAALQKATAEYFANGRAHRFGDFLVKNSYITPESLERALRLQGDSFRSLRELVVEQGLVSEEALEQVLDTST